MTWIKEQQDIRDNKFTFDWGHTTIPGTLTIEARLSYFSIPVGFMWYSIDTGRRINIGYIWVHPEVRRCGLATKLLDALVESHDDAQAVVTGEGNELSTPWLKANGFKNSKKHGCWIKKLKRGGGSGR